MKLVEAGVMEFAPFQCLLLSWYFYQELRYRYKKCLGSPIVHICQVVVAAMKKRKIELPSNTALLYKDYSEALRIHHTDQFCSLDKASIVTERDYGSNGTLTVNPWELCQVTRAEEVQKIIRLLPIWATTIIFWTTYAQLITFSVEQASTMERSIGDFQIPAGPLTVFFVSTILISLVAYDGMIMPLWKKWKGKPGFTNLQRVAIGLFLSAMGMVCAAIAEVKRLSVARAFGASVTTTTLPITVFLLIPQFFLVGSGEAFIYTGQLDFFITQSPKRMKTMSTGLFLPTFSLGFFVSSLLVLIVKAVTGSSGRQGWVGENINKGRLDCFYGLLAALSFINFGLFLLCAAWYKRRTAKRVAEMDIMVNGCSAEEKC